MISLVIQVLPPLMANLLALVISQRGKNALCPND